MSKELKAMQDISDVRNNITPDLTLFDADKFKDAIKQMNEKGIVFVNSKKIDFNISFDFDNTLDTEQMQNLCEKYMKLGAEVFVTTSRARIVNKKEIDHSDLFEVTDRLGINRENIIFTAYQDKYQFLDKMDIHYDDSIEEIFLINECPNKCIGFLFEEKHNNGIVNF